jgi:adhesin transport system membrane fusion protein
MQKPNLSSLNNWQLNDLKNIQSPRIAHYFARLIALMLVVSIVILSTLPWQQNVKGKGQVIAFSPLERRQDIEAPIKGRISQWYVQEGSKVKKGDLIAKIRDNDPEYFQRLERQRETLMAQISLNEAKANAYELQAQDFGLVIESTAAAAQAKLEASQSKADALERELEGALAAQETSRINLERETLLREKGLSSQRKYELTLLKFQSNAAKVNQLRSKISAAQGDIREARANKDKAEQSARAKRNSAQATLEDARSSVQKSRAELLKIETALARQATQDIRAPRDGVILKLNTFSDTVFVKEGEKLATLVPNMKERAVEVYLDGNDIPLVSPGREVRLQFEGWPALQFSGWPEVAIGTFEGRVALMDATDTKDGKFRIVVLPGEGEEWPDRRFLRQGVQVKAWVLLNTVPLGYELWRQFNGFPPNLSEPAKTESTNPIKRKSKK